MVPTARSDAATEQLARYGEAFGIDGGKSRAVVKRTFDSATGGSIVRADQVVDGVPVFGGQVVMSLDEDQGVVSVDAATTAATQVPAAVVSEAKAERNALAVDRPRATGSRRQADCHRARAAASTTPRSCTSPTPSGVRPVWEFEVTNGSDIRETVLVGTGRGEIALHFNDAPGINRVVCDNANAQRPPASASPVPLCIDAGPRRRRRALGRERRQRGLRQPRRDLRRLPGSWPAWT